MCGGYRRQLADWHVNTAPRVCKISIISFAIQVSIFTSIVAKHLIKRELIGNNNMLVIRLLF